MLLSPCLRLGSFPIFSLEVGPCCSMLNSIWLHRLYLSFLSVRCDSLLCIFTALCNSSEGTLPPDLQCGIIWLPGFLAQHEVSHWLSALLSWEGDVEILRAKALLLNLSVCLEMKLPWTLAVARLFFCIPWKSWHFPLTNGNTAIPKKGTFLLTFISWSLHFRPLVFFPIAADLIMFLVVRSKMIKASIHSCFLWKALLTFLFFSLFKIYFLVLYLTFLDDLPLYTGLARSSWVLGLKQVLPPSFFVLYLGDLSP